MDDRELLVKLIDEGKLRNYVRAQRAYQVALAASAAAAEDLLVAKKLVEDL